MQNMMPESPGEIFEAMMRKVHGEGVGFLFGVRLSLQHPEYMAALAQALDEEQPNQREVQLVKRGIDKFVANHPLALRGAR